MVTVWQKQDKWIESQIKQNLNKSDPILHKLLYNNNFPWDKHNNNSNLWINKLVVRDKN